MKCTADTITATKRPITVGMNILVKRCVPVMGYGR